MKTAETPKHENRSRGRAGRVPSIIFNARNVASAKYLILAVFALGAIGYLIMLVPGSEFWEPDESKYGYGFLLSGYFMPVPIFPDGRFYPLWPVLPSLIGTTTKSVDILHAMMIVLSIASAGLVWQLLSNLPLFYRAFPTMLTATVPSIFYVSQSFIYPEPLLILLTSLFMYSYLKCVGRDHNRFCFAIALLSASCALFYKETAIVIFFCFAFAELTCRHRKQTPAQLTLLNLLLLGMCGLFVLSYVIVMYFIRSGPAYGDVTNISVGSIVHAFLWHCERDKVFLVALTFFMLRCLLWASRRTVYLPFWDSMTIAAMGFYGANILLGLTGPYSYYLAPADFISIVCWTAISYYSVGSKYSWRGLTPISSAMLIMVVWPTTITYAIEYKELCSQYKALIEYIIRLATANTNRKPVIIYVHEPLWVSQGLAYALAYNGLHVSGSGIGDEAETPAGKSASRLSEDTISGVILENYDSSSSLENTQKKPSYGDLVLLCYTSFWFRKRTEREKVEMYFTKAEYALVFPELSRALVIDPLRAYLFRVTRPDAGDVTERLPRW